MKRTVLAIFFLSYCYGSTVSAFAAKKMSISEIQELAISRSKQIRAAALVTQAEQSRSQAAGLLPNPSFLFQGGYADLGGVTGPTYDYTLSQAIPFPGKRGKRERIQELHAGIAKVNEEEAKLLVQHAVTIAAVTLADVEELTKHSLERQKRYKLIQSYLRSHPQVSPSQKIETALIENEIRILEKGILELTLEHEQAMAELNFYLQLSEPIEVLFDWNATIDLPSKAELEARLFEHHPEWRRQSLELERATEVVSLAKRELWPDFTLSLNYRVEQSAPQNDFYAGGIGISLPFWDHGQHAIPAARAMAEAAELSRDLLRDRVKSEFEQAWQKLVRSDESLKLFPVKLADNLEKKFDEAEREFRRGRITTSIFLQADAQIHNTMDAIFQSRVTLLQNLSQVMLMTGQKLEWRSHRAD